MLKLTCYQLLEAAQWNFLLCVDFGGPVSPTIDLHLATEATRIQPEQTLALTQW